MKTRIVIHAPDRANDIKVEAQRKEWFSDWMRFSTTYAFGTAVQLPSQEEIDRAVDEMKTAIDLARKISEVIKYPEDQ
jgi:hypothetical protein